MNAATEFDLGPLTWVKGEIDSALERASEALGQFKDSKDTTKIKFCRTHVHQVHGALAIVGLDGVTQVTEALESLLLAIEEEKVPASAGTMVAVEQALPAIRQYLDDLMAGEANQPLRLLPVYRVINEARGTGRQRASDLFFPDLTVRPPKRSEPVAKLAPEEFRQCLKSERMRFQKGLLAWLKNPPGSVAAFSGLDQMRVALKKIEATQETPAARSFWWVSQGFLDALADQSVAAEQDAKQLCARIDMQIRRLLEGSRNVAERLMRDALYFVGRAPGVDEGLAAQIRHSFQLDGLIPTGEAAVTSAPQESALRRLREVVVAIEEFWNKFCAGNTAALAGFAEQAKNCAQITANIGQTDIKRLGQGLASTAAWLSEDATRQSEVVAMEVATAILLLQNAQENFKRLGVDFARQVDLMVARLQACVSGTSVDNDEDVPLLDEMTRRAQEKLLVAQVAREIQSNLGQVEQALDTFFRDPVSGLDAVSLDGSIKQISGALSILGHDKALFSLQDCAAQIKRFGEKDYQPADADFEAVAQQLSTLGFFIDALQTGASDYDVFVRRLRGEELPTPEEDQEPEADHAIATSVEAELEQKKGDTQALIEALRETPQDEQLKTELKQNLQSLQADADLVADHALGETAKAALSALQAGGDVSPELDATLSTLKPGATETPSPSAETLKLAQASHEEIDAELLEIFLEEAHEVLGNLMLELDKLRAHPGDIDSLTNIRRAAHTLKGSGRMVGLKDLGEVAWEVEQTINLWLRQEAAVSPAMLDLIACMHSVFTIWVHELSENTGNAPDASALVAQANSLRGVEAAFLAPVAAGAAIAAASADLGLDDEMPSHLAATFVGVGAMFGMQEQEAEAPEQEPSVDFSFSLDIPELPVASQEESASQVEIPDQMVVAEGAAELSETDVPEHLLATVVSSVGMFEAAEAEPPIADVAPEMAMDFDFELDIAAEPEPEPEPEPTAVEPEVPEFSAGVKPDSEKLALGEELSASVEPEAEISFDLGELPEPSDEVIDIVALAAPVEFVEPPTPVAAASTPFVSIAMDETSLEQTALEVAARESEMPGSEADFSFDITVEESAADVDAGVGAELSLPVSEFSADELLGVDVGVEVESSAELPAEIRMQTVEEALAELEGLPADEEPDVQPEPPAEISPASAEAVLGTLPGSAAELESGPETTTISPVLYDIFQEEARGHLDVLASSFAELEADPKGPTTFAMTRAAHTLGGIAATVGLMPINKLAIALEHALLRRDNCTHADSIEGIEIVRQTILALEEMFVGLGNQLAPGPQAVLIDSLDEIFPLQAPSTESIGIALAPESGEPAPASAAESAAGLEAQVEMVTEVATRLQEMPLLQDELDDQLLPIFLEEAQDLVLGFAEQLGAWRQNPSDAAEAARALARLMHTFKGGARMAGAMNLGEMTHTLEAGLEEALRTGSLSLHLLDHIESGCDTLTQIVERLLAGESPSLTLPMAEMEEIEPLLTSATASEALPAAASDVAAKMAAAPASAAAESETGQRAQLRVRADLVDRLVNEAGELSIARARIEGEMLGLKGSLLDLTENVIRLRRQLREIEIQAEGQIQARVAQTSEDEAKFDPLELDRFTRFQELTRFMAESVNDVATVQQSLLKNLDDANAAITAQSRMNRSLQQDLMSIRMEPFANQGQRLYRIARQTAKELNKRVDLDIRGGHVELDRSVQDKIMAPIEHMLRNAISHGIEDRATRQAAGKPDTGEVTLTLSQEGNEIVVAMADDGRGLDIEGIRARAISQGLLAPGEAVDDTRLYDFIFHAGFSTATEVTQISGRGVGMDVVKSEITSLGGRIEIASEAGKGTTFRLYLPLTLAVTQTLLVRAAGTLYAIPSNMIEQVLELKDAGLADIRQRGEAEWMGNRYPFHFLPHLLGSPDALPEARRRYWVLLLRSGTQRVSVQVDELSGNREVVVKNIGAQLSRVVGIAGATVLGDGRVVLILNPVALASRQASVSIQLSTAATPVGELAVAAPATPVLESAAQRAATTLPTVMVVDDSLTVRKITGRLLAREGYQVITAKDGVDALEHLVDTIPDVMLSDIEMPRMDGFDLVRNVRADERLKTLPIIMITSRTADKHRNYALEIGANEYLGKPYDEDTLLAMIAKFIKEKRS